jgi:uncharacterized protein YhjY with autotransporter beta-barrel domain
LTIVNDDSGDPPIAVAGDDQTLVDSDGDGFVSVELDGSGSSDLDGTIVSYQWLVDGTEVATSVTATVDVPVGNITVTLIVTDDADNTDEDSFTVNATTDFRKLTEIPGLSAKQREVAEYLDELCPRIAILGGERELTDGEQNLLTRCNAIRSTGTTDEQAIGALGVLSDDRVATMSTHAIDFGAVQHGNLEMRINAVRQGATGLDVGGLTMNIGGENLSVDRLLASLNMLLANDEGEGKGSSEVLGGSLFGSSRLGIFINGSVQFGDKDATLRESEYDFDTIELTAGADYRFTDNLFLGFALGYGKTDLEFSDAAGSLDTQNLAASIYGSYYVANKFYLDSIFSYGDADHDLVRNIVYTDVNGAVNEIATGGAGGKQTTFGLGFGYDFQRGGLIVGPNLGVYYFDVEVDEFAEEGTSGLELEYSSQSVDSLTLNVGLHASYVFNRSWGVLIPHFRGDYVREFKNSSQIIQANFVNDPFIDDINNPSRGISIRTDDPDTGYGVIGAGLSAQFPRGISAFADYETFLGLDDISSHEFKVGIRFEMSFE